jgi:uracil-DNA glycosylase
MMKKKINQKNLSKIKFYKTLDFNIFLSSSPINRYKKPCNVLGTNKTDKLYNLKEKIKLIKGCEFKKNSTNIVFSDGNCESKIMIVGGETDQFEDDAGIPFVNENGELLNKMLKAIKLNRSNVYITNTINYKVPNNKRASDEEINRYIPFLINHIDIINPKILILLGSVATNALLGKQVALSQKRGEWIKNKIGNSFPEIIASFHPKFLIIQPGQKKFAWKDLQLIQKKIISLKLF